MNKLKLQLKSMTEGTHKMEFRLDNDFFEKLGGTEFRTGDVIADISAYRTSQTHELTIHLHGIIQVPCDYCLDDMDLPINTKNRLIVKFGHDYTEETDEIIIIPEEEGEIDLSWYLYEFIALSIPMRHVHPDGKCTAETAEKLRQHLAIESNEDEESDDDDSNTSTDPRWDALKQLINNN